MTRAPRAAASSISPTALSIDASRSRKTGAAWIAATLKRVVSDIPSLLASVVEAARRVPEPAPLLRVVAEDHERAGVVGDAAQPRRGGLAEHRVGARLPVARVQL